jgi:hypothetical protein
MSALVWVNLDNITLDHPVMDAAGSEARAIFIWDGAEMNARHYSLKRRVFIFECVQDLGVPIYVGDPVDILSALAEEADILTAHTPDPYVRDVLADLRDTHTVRVIDTPTLAVVPAGTDTGRFFRFWNKAKRSALTHSQTGTSS